MRISTRVVIMAIFAAVLFLIYEEIGFEKTVIIAFAMVLGNVVDKT